MGQFDNEKLKFDYFKKLEKVQIKLQWMRKLAVAKKIKRFEKLKICVE